MSSTAQQVAAHASSSSTTGSSLLEVQCGSDRLAIRIQNMTATADMGMQINLKKLARKCRNTEFNPRRYGAVIMKLRNPSASAVLFHSGKMCLTGIRTAQDASTATTQVANLLRSMGFKASNNNNASSNNESSSNSQLPPVECRIQTIVASTEVGFPVRLEDLVYAHSTFASYEPEVIPNGLIYRPAKPPVVCIIFGTGRIIINGAKKEQDLVQALTLLHPILQEFKKSVPAGMEY